MKLVTSAQMRELEQRAVEAGTSIDAMMEAAGLAVAQEAWLSLGVIAGRRVLVLVGPGNNGGDGLVAARHLADWEADVVVYLLAPRPDDANLKKVRELGVPVQVAPEDAGYAALAKALDGAEIIIDALLGTGPSRPIEGVLAAILERVRDACIRPRPPLVVAVDLPTGVDADTGRADPLVIRAGLTVTFGAAKVGLYTLPGSEYAGSVQVVDIGIPKEAERDLPVELLRTAWVRDRLPARPKDSNKGTFGRVLVVAGSSSYVGAPRLAAEAAYRVGAGLVTVACAAQVQPSIAPALPEATYLPYESESGALTPAAGREIIEALDSYDVLLIGPGLSQAPGVGDVVAGILAKVPERAAACVIDADALNALAQQPAWSKQITRPCVLTPHAGEMSRLLGATVEAVQGDRLGVAVKAAAEWRQAVVLKGAHTVIAAPDGRACVSPHANPLLATAGTGDVLAGAIAGLLAQGMAPFEAACCGVFLHGLAAEEAGDALGDRGMLAGDLLPALPRAIRTAREGRLARSFARPGHGGLGALGGDASLSEPS
ncbi:MAG: NAD(P)H-hydrate dehydratase [Dehalococcoidia bacterium]